MQELVKLICDINFMKQQMKEIGYDAKKMPLGKISQKMIRQGYQVRQAIAAFCAHALQQLQQLYLGVLTCMLRADFE